MVHKPIKIVAIFNECTSETIPFENFLHVYGVGITKLVVSFSQTTPELEVNVDKMGKSGNVEILGLGGAASFWAKLRLLRRKLGQFSPDVIHSHHALSSVIGIFVFRRQGARHLITVHNDFKRMRLRHKILFTLSYMFSDLIICNSETTRASIEAVRKWLFPFVEIRVIYNGVNSTRVGVCRSKKNGPEARTVNFLTVARFVEQKDHETLILAFSKLRSHGIRANLSLIGDGPLKHRIQVLVSERRIVDDVKFLGLMDRDSVYARLRSADAFVITSRYEGFCNAMVEAAMAGVPIIASDIATLKEVLGADNGLFFEVGNSEKLCLAMVDCIERAAEAMARVKDARVWALDRYSLKYSATQHTEVYRSISEKRL